MAEQTFRSPGFFEREIDLASRRQAISGVPGGVIGTSAKGPAFVPVTVGDFTDFISRFGGLDPNRPAVYAAFEFLKNKRALTFMRVLGAGGNDTAADRDATRTQGVVKGAGFRVHGNQTSINAKRISSGDVETYASVNVVDGGVFLVTAQHKLDVDTKSSYGVNTLPLLQDNPSVARGNGYAQMLRGVVYTAAGYRLTAMGTAATYTYASYNPAGDDVAAVATLDITNDITLTSVATGEGRNSNTFTIQVVAPAANPLATVLAVFTGTAAAIVCTITPNNGDNNGDTAVNLTTAELRELITSGAVAGKTVTVTDGSSLRALQTAAGGAADVLITDGEGDDVVATFANGFGDAATMLSTDGLVSLLDSDSAISTQEFKIVIVGTDNATVYRTITASLDPEHPSYISKVLNTNPHKFLESKHLLYLDLPVEDELAPVSKVFVAPPADKTVADSPFSGAYQKAWSVMGRMDTRYSTAKSPGVISQPFGTQEFDIMYFESLSDGDSGNEEVKVSIANIKASLDEANPWGTFEVLVRKFRDLDSDPEILESYPGCTLDSNSERFIGRVIGDYKAVYNFDADIEEERRIIVTGKYPNRSLYVRVVMSDLYESGEIPNSALPFGFRGIPVLKTSESLTDDAMSALMQGSTALGNTVSAATDLDSGDKTRIDTKILIDETDREDRQLASPIFPPLPMRYKVTRGKMPSGDTSPSGNPALTEKVDSKLYWGMKSERLPRTGSVTHSVLNPNAGSMFNELIAGYTKFQGILKSGALVTGSAADEYNANKFTLARVALNKASSASNIAEFVSSSARDHMLEAVYLRDAAVDGSNYTVQDPDGTTLGRVTMATLLASSSVKFNRFTTYNKFTFPLFGGFDGLNILDLDSHRMNDKAASADAPTDFEGRASTEFDTGFAAKTGLYGGKPGIGQRNSTVISYQQASRIMTDPMTVRHNILAIPGIRDSFITDFAAEKTKEYSLALYLMDIPPYAESGARLFGTENRTAFTGLRDTTPDVRETAETFSSRVVDSNYSATYFPDVILADSANSTQVKVPASVAAMKALAFSDSVSFPWFAPAGFNRGALDNVTSVDVRLTAGDRDELYDARINPIANFPDGGIVIFGQKTLQLAKSALDRVNVRRMLLEIKRLITGVAERLLFEPNNSETRARFINLVTPLLATVQAQAGVESFKIIMDDTNNNSEDVENNRLNGRIVVVPTRAIEFIAIDFIITNSGVSFE